MKKIFVITWYYSNNFGTSLQAYALQRFLCDEGYSVFLLNHFLLDGSTKAIIKNIAGRLGLIGVVRFFKFFNSPRLREYIKDEIKEEYVFSDNELELLLKNADAFVTGSDQIWNSYFCFDPFYYLAFAEGKKKIAYASSIGTDSIAPQYKRKVVSLLNKFKKIGVREESAVSVLTTATGRKDIIQVLDPTFLLDAKRWLDFSEHASFSDILPNNYIFCYFIGNNDFYTAQLEDVRQRTGIGNVVMIPSTENPNFRIHGSMVFQKSGPKEFIYYIQHAKFVCTDSFHATALSINMAKDFVVFKRFKDTEKVSQNSRLYDLLNHYNLGYRLYSENDACINKIDYATVSSKLSEDRAFSREFLINAIEN